MQLTMSVSANHVMNLALLNDKLRGKRTVSLAQGAATPNGNDKSNSKYRNYHRVTSKARQSTSIGHYDTRGPSWAESPLPLLVQDVEDSDDDYKEENENSSTTLKELLVLVKDLNRPLTKRQVDP